VSEIRILWDWVEAWTEQAVAGVHLPQLFLERLPGKPSLYVSGEFTAYGDEGPQITAPAAAILRAAWSISGTDSGTVDSAPRGAALVASSVEVASVEELLSLLRPRFATDANYVVKIGGLTITEQDGDILVFEADRTMLRRLFDEIDSLSTSQAWTFISSADDWPDDLG